jgi:hypothetical protein
MMKKYKRKRLLIFALLISNWFYGQDYETVSKSDTIYIIYTGNLNEKKYVFPPENFGYNDREYHFVIKDGDTIRNSITFFHGKYIRRNDMEYRKESDKRRINKRFIKRNKNIIIGIDFFKKYDFCKLKEKIINKLRIIYLIDLTEKKKSIPNMFEVSPSDICQFDE